MPETLLPPPKPRAEVLRPQLAGLPGLPWWRHFLRWIVARIARVMIWLFTRTQVQGLERFPRQGPGLIVANHLGDADFVAGLAYSPSPAEVMAKAELHDYPILGWFMKLYGVIWVHRGQPDRAALKAALQGLAEGRFVAIAPEGRESITGSLEEGTGGAAYLALKAGTPIIPVTFTGTENERVYTNLKRFRRTGMSLTVGYPFHLEQLSDRREAIAQGTDTIMRTLAQQLPPEYRGVYQTALEETSERA